jgi:pimeloyl-ACP methyl ester carboxylesterase
MTANGRLLNEVAGIPDLMLAYFPDPTITKSPVEREAYLGLLDFYDPERWDQEQNSFFYLPDEPPENEVIETVPFGVGRRDLVRYPSRYVPRNPELIESFNRHRENLSGYLHLWRHDDATNRPLVFIIHGLLMGGPGRARHMFKIDRLFELGLDLALYTLPGHWRRSDIQMFQRLLDPADVPLTVERMAQNIHDLHSALILLRQAGYEKIGIIGASMGGLTASLYAAQVENGPEFMFLAVPAVTLDRYLAPRPSRFGFPIDSELVRATERAQHLYSPLFLTPRFDVDRMRVVAHAGDRLCEAGHTRRWVKNWGIQDYIEVVGGHWLYLDRRARGDAWYGLLEERGFIEARDGHPGPYRDSR